jgi:hypothetical protein
MYLDTDPGYEDEAIAQERFDADLEMAELTARANAADRERRQGICQHSSRIGGNPEKVYYPEHFILSPGEQICTERTGGCLLIAPDDIVDDEDGIPVWHYMPEWEPSKWADDWAGTTRFTLAADRIAALPEPKRSIATRAILNGESGEGVSYFMGGWQE